MIFSAALYAEQKNVAQPLKRRGGGFEDLHTHKAVGRFLKQFLLVPKVDLLELFLTLPQDGILFISFHFRKIQKGEHPRNLRHPP